MQLTCCLPSPLWTLRRKLLCISVMKTYLFILLPCNKIQISGGFQLLSSPLF